MAILFIYNTTPPGDACGRFGDAYPPLPGLECSRNSGLFRKISTDVHLDGVGGYLSSL